MGSRKTILQFGTQRSAILPFSFHWLNGPTASSRNRSCRNHRPAPTEASTGVEIKEGMIALFTLSNKNRGTATSSAWKIESPAQPICVNLSTAQRYLAAVSKAIRTLHVGRMRHALW